MYLNLKGPVEGDLAVCLGEDSLLGRLFPRHWRGQDNKAGILSGEGVHIMVGGSLGMGFLGAL